MVAEVCSKTSAVGLQQWENGRLECTSIASQLAAVCTRGKHPLDTAVKLNERVARHIYNRLLGISVT